MTPSSTASKSKTSHRSTSSSSEIERRSCKKLKRRCVTNRFFSSLKSTKQEQRKNKNKFRIRNLPESPNEDTKSLVIETLNSSLKTTLTPSDIVSCERVSRWDRFSKPKDIVVTFADVLTREQTYRGKLLQSDLPFEIVEELGEERGQIWTEAVVSFGEKNVFSVAGVIHIVTRKRYRHEIRTMWQFRTIMKKISTEIHSYTGDSSDENEYASDSSEELASTSYGSGRKNSKLEKKFRLRKVPEVPDEDIKFEVLQYILINLQMELEVSDIVGCERVVGWDGCVEPRDISVTLRYKHLQKNILYHRNFLEFGHTKILEELTQEMADVWCLAVKRFGAENVYTNDDNVVSISIDGSRKPMYSRIQYMWFLMNYFKVSSGTNVS